MKTLLICIRSFLLLFVYGFFLFSANAQIHQPVLQVPFINTAPLIDGKIIDAPWQKAAVLTEFVNWARNSYIKDPVTVFICYDEKNIYIAFRNSDPEAGELFKSVNPKGPRDTFLWGRNHALVGITYKDVHIQVMADPKGTMTDWKDGDIKWNGTWQYAASINTSDWSAEFAIPVGDLAENGITPGTDLSVNISRSFPHGESSSWSGKCILSTQSNVKSGFGRWPDPVPGINTLSFNAENFGNAPTELQAELTIYPLNAEPQFINQEGQGPSSDFQICLSTEPLTYNDKFLIPAGGVLNEKIPFDLTFEGSYLVSASILSTDGSMIRRNVDYWFTIKPNRQRIRYLKRMIGESIAAMTRLTGPVINKLKIEADHYYEEVLKLESSVEDLWNSGKWNELTANTDKIENEIIRHLHNVRWCAVNNWSGDWDFGIGLTHSIVKLKKDKPFPNQLSNRIEISLAGNEYESIQLVLLPFKGDMNNIVLEISDLEGRDGTLIKKENIEVSLVDYNKINWQADYVAEKGWHPDPLIPFKNGMSLKGDDLCRPLWITVYAPPGTKSGDYSGKIIIRADGMKEVQAIIKCRVWGFDLPVVSHLKTHSWDQINFLKGFYNLEEYPLEWYQNFCGLLLKHRFNPGSAGVNYRSEKTEKNGNYDFSKVEKVLSYCIERGLTRFSIIQMKKGLYTPEEEEAVYKFIEAYARFLKQKGWLDKGLVELWDEPTDLEWPYIKERAERIKKIDPEIRLQLFAEGGPYEFSDKSTDQYGLNDLVDIWAPVNIVESPETQAQDGEIWTYFCTLARGSAPNFFIDRPAIYQRSIAWYCWMYGVDGFEHWSTNYFWRNVHEGKPMEQKWPNIPWDSRTYYYYNGEGQLVYPGPGGATYSSIRLENFRDSMEDYEYLYKLSELLAANNQDDPEINGYRQLLKPDEYLLIKNPRKIKVTLENTIRYPDQPEKILEYKEKIALAIEKLQNNNTLKLK